MKAARGAPLSGHEPPGLSAQNMTEPIEKSSSEPTPCSLKCTALQGAGYKQSTAQSSAPLSRCPPHLRCCPKTCRLQVLQQRQPAAPCPLRSWAGRRRSARAALTPGVRLRRRACSAGPVRKPAAARPTANISLIWTMQPNKSIPVRTMLFPTSTRTQHSSTADGGHAPPARGG